MTGWYWKISPDTIGRKQNGQPLDTISIRQIADVPPPPENHAVIGLVYDLGPDGATFDPPVSLTFKYDESLIPTGIPESSLSLAFWDEEQGAWIEIPCVVDPETNTITAEIAHFSRYMVMARALPAEFLIFDVSVTPEVINPGEETTINVLVTNTGDLPGTDTIGLKVNDNNETSKEVYLDGGTKQIVTFSVSESIPGTYRIAISELLGVFYVRSPALFTLTGLSVQPDKVKPGESVTITASVINTGDLEGQYTPAIIINGLEDTAPAIPIAPGETANYDFSVRKDTPGTYEVTFYDMDARCTVSDILLPEDTTPPPDASLVTPKSDKPNPTIQPTISEDVTPESGETNWTRLTIIIVVSLAALLVLGIGIIFIKNRRI